MKKKLVSLLLIATMAVSVVACGSEGSTTTASSKESETVSKESETVSKESEVKEESKPEVEAITYPLDTDDSLSIFAHMWQLEPQSRYADYTESPFHKGLAKNTGVDLEWIFPALGEDHNQAYNLMLAEEELPNIIFSGFDGAELEQLYDDGLIYDLTDYIPIYAPDYWALINQPEYNLLWFHHFEYKKNFLFYLKEVLNQNHQ